MPIHIEINSDKVKQFVKDWPMVKPVKYGKYTTTFSMPTKVYQKQYKLIDKYGSMDAPECVNYVKITGSMAGQAVKLFIKEKDCFKALKSLSTTYAAKVKPNGPFIVTMKKVRIVKTRSYWVDHIVIASMKKVGLAA